jgi:hypothetical protein
MPKYRVTSMTKTAKFHLGGWSLLIFAVVLASPKAAGNELLAGGLLFLGSLIIGALAVGIPDDAAK